MKKLIILLGLVATSHADVLQPPISEAQWTPFWEGEGLGPFVVFVPPSTVIYTDGYIFSGAINGPSPLGTFSYQNDILSWHLTLPLTDARALWVDVNDAEFYKINHQYFTDGSVEIGTTHSITIYGLRPVPDTGSTIALLALGFGALALFRRR